MSEDFQKIINDRKKVSELVVGSCNDSGSFEVWRKVRYFTSQVFTKDGTVLDIGCANGFFLRCLQEWTQHELIPYGIDTEKKSISAARQLFPHRANNFAVLDAFKLSEFKKLRFPERFDYIYTFPLDKKNFDLAYNMVARNGRIIVAFYGSNKYEVGSDSHERERSQQIEKIEKFQSEIMNFDRVIANPENTNHFIGVINK